MNTTPPDCAILGLGYLGLSLTQKLYERGSRACIVKHSFTSDDINLPIRLDTADLNRSDVFQTAFRQHWADKPTRFCLLPPLPLAHYVDTLKQWLVLAEHMGIQHIVYTSSASVYGSAVRVCDEDTPPDPQTETIVQILAAERILLAGRIPHIDILRLSGLYSATRRPLNRLSLKNNIRGGRQPVNVVHQDSAVAALSQTALHPQGRRIRNIVEPSHPARAGFYAAEAAKLGLPAPDFNSVDCSGGKIVNIVFGNVLSL